MLKNGVPAHSSEYLAAPPEELGMTQDPRMGECCSTRPGSRVLEIEGLEV